MEVKNQLISDGVDKSKLADIKVQTLSLFKKQFEFPSIAKNEYSQEQFDQLEIAERNLNSNPENKDLQKAFIKTAQQVKSNFKEKYGETWTDPTTIETALISTDEQKKSKTESLEEIEI